MRPPGSGFLGREKVIGAQDARSSAHGQVRSNKPKLCSRPCSISHRLEKSRDVYKQPPPECSQHRANNTSPPNSHHRPVLKNTNLLTCVASLFWTLGKTSLILSLWLVIDVGKQSTSVWRSLGVLHPTYKQWDQPGEL